MSLKEEERRIQERDTQSQWEMGQSGRALCLSGPSGALHTLLGPAP